MRQDSTDKSDFPFWWIPFLLVGLYLAPHWLRDIPTQAWFIIVPLLPTAVAKFISKLKGAKGKMSREYKDVYEENKRLYIIFSISTVIFPVIVATSENIYSDVKILSDNAERIVGIIWLALTGICGIGWVLTEVIRRDFPWGLFRLIERLFYLALLVAGAFVGTNFLAGLIETYPGFFQAVVLILIPIAFFTISALFFVTVRELFFILLYPDPVKRKAYKDKMDREYAQHQKQKAREDAAELAERWENASITDRSGSSFRHLLHGEIRVDKYGQYIDKDGKAYRKEDLIEDDTISLITRQLDCDQK